jgi:hypothetical protein
MAVPNPSSVYRFTHGEPVLQMNAVIRYARLFGFGHVLKPLLCPPLTDIRAMILPKRTEFALRVSRTRLHLRVVEQRSNP